jgi:HAD superfamily hydrolase (TIGR01484 family)
VVSDKLPLPLAELAPAQCASVLGVMTDIDDTLTRDGEIEPVALDALQALAAARLPVIAITGRPLGWSEARARQWPVAALVAENGGVALVRDGLQWRAEFAQDATTRERNARRMQELQLRLLREVPGATPARDSPGRVTDIAIDHAEHAHLAPAAIERVLATMREAGMNATVSSIHVNGWFGAHSKLSAAHGMVGRLYGRVLQAEIGRWVYVGDSPNDEQMFEHFPLSVGVANLRRHAAGLRVWPRYITRGERGAGFAELARALLAARLL